MQAGLDALGDRATSSTPRLVRGLDYYTSTTFEFLADALDAAQNAIGGGGRYDGLAEQIGGPPTPGIGFGIGIERVLIACDAEGVFAAPRRRVDVFVVDARRWRAPTSRPRRELREDGIGAERAYGGRSLKAQMKAADRSGGAAYGGDARAGRGRATARRGGRRTCATTGEQVEAAAG